MPPLVIAIGAALYTAGVATWAVGVLAYAIVGGLLLGALVAAQALLAPKPGSINQGNEIDLKLDPTMPRQIIVGEEAIGGSVGWAFTYTDGNIPNRYLVRIIALSDLPCTGLVAITEGANTYGQIANVLTFSGDPTTGWVTCNQHRNKTGGAMMSIRVYLGNQTTADSNLVSWSGGQWTNNHIGKSTCYAAIRLDYGPVAFPNGEPRLVFQLQGAACYDQRQDSTRTSPSRSGSQRLATPSTWAYTTNAAVIAQQVLRGFYVNGQLIFGCGASDTDVPDAMLLAAYNTCDTAVALPTPPGGTEAQYKASMILTSSESNQQVLSDLQAAMDGNIYDRSGVCAIIPGGSRTPVFTLTDNDIVWEDEKSWQDKASVDALYNCITGTYIPKSQQFVETPFPVLTNTTWEADDGGARYVRNIGYRAIIGDAQVQRINKRVYGQSRFQGTVSFVLGLMGLQVEQGDWFQLTSARWGFSNKYFAATNVNFTTKMRVGIVGQETSPTIDGWVPATDYVTPTITTRAAVLQTVFQGTPPSLNVDTTPVGNLIIDQGIVDPFYWNSIDTPTTAFLSTDTFFATYMAAPQGLEFDSTGGTAQTQSDVRAIPIPCLASTDYYMSALFGVTTGFNGDIFMAIEWLDATQTYISTTPLFAGFDYRSVPAGARTIAPSNANKNTSPSNAAYGRVVIGCAWPAGTSAGKAYVALPTVPSLAPAFLNQAAAATDPTVAPGATYNQAFYQPSDPVGHQYISGVYTAGTYIVPDGAFWVNSTTGVRYDRLHGMWVVSIPQTTWADGDVLHVEAGAGSHSYTVPTSYALGHVDIIVEGGAGGDFWQNFHPWEVAQYGGGGEQRTVTGVAVTAGVTTFNFTVGSEGTDGPISFTGTNVSDGTDSTMTSPAITAKAGHGAPNGTTAGTGGTGGSGGSGVAGTAGYAGITSAKVTWIART